MHITKLQNDLILTTIENTLIRIPPDAPPTTIALPSAVAPAQPHTINGVAASADGQYLAVSTEGKQLVVFTGALRVLGNVQTARVASRLLFAPTNDLVVADKTGDVFAYALAALHRPPALLLGHLGMVLDAAFSACGRYLLTCDRDEKIRVSRYPRAHSIAAFCLGHGEFVTRLRTTVDGLLFSASGDGTVGVWRYATGANVDFVRVDRFLDDRRALEAFSREMDEEGVEVSALPVSDLVLRDEASRVCLIVQLHNYNGVVVLYFDRETNRTQLGKVIEPILFPFVFCLADSLLYVLNSVDSYVFDAENDFVACSCKRVQDAYKDIYKNFKVVSNNFITVLYKRKYDNVKEYLERKRLRLEAK